VTGDTAGITAIVGGERAARNERRLHAAIKVRAAELAVPHIVRTGALFKSFFIGGFEGTVNLCGCGRGGTRSLGWAH
jgi:hypothetical protein